MDRLTFWKFGIAVLVAVGFNFAQGRQNGDSLAVGESVLVSIFVESDLDTFRVAACGTISCGGVRVQGVDSKGMGYITFHSKAQPNPFQEKWFTRTSEPFGTTYGPGREHTFVIHRPGEKEMLIWLQEKNERKAKVSIPKGEVKLFVQFKNGIYRFLDEKEERAAARIARQRECATGSKRNLDNSNEKGADIVEVSVGCRYHGNDKEQSMCVVYLAVEGEKGEQEIYRSEIARNDYDPFLQQKVRLPFKFHEKQILIFSVYNNYSDCDTPPSEDLIGTLQTSFAAVNTKGKVELTMKETSAVEYSVLFTTNCDEKLTLDLSGKNIPGRGQPFLRILKSPPHSSGSKNHDFTKVAETNKVQRDISFFKWEEITLSIKALCDGDYNLPIKVYVLEEYEGATNLLGHFMTTAKELKSPRNKFSIISSSNEEVFDDAHKAAEIYIGEVPQNATFSQYIAVGFQLVGTLQIDFTASNSVVDPPLHLQSDKPNKYELAIHSVGEVVEPFISDNKFKAFGFGAILPTGETSFDFALNLTANDPDCFGVEGVMGAYKNTLKKLKEHGPTYFAPAVRKIVNMAKPYQDGSKYFVHLLLTDGKLEDPQETDEAILEASDLPISIVIVGIGDGDFSSLTAMAKPFEVEKSKIKQWNERNRETRDILQFVAMNEFTADNNEKLKHELRQAVLFKIPEQYLEFMKIRKILPKPPRNSTITRVCE